MTDSPTPLQLTFLAQPPLVGSGGYRMILTMADQLHQRGHNVTIHVKNDKTFADETALRRFLADHFFETQISLRLGHERFAPCDALIATYWETAYTVRELVHLARRGAYFVQDFEPLFHKSVAGYQRAEATYTFGLQHITVGPWLTHKLRTDFNADADFIDMPLNRDRYRHAPDRDRTVQRVVFLAQPEKPRRRYEMGLAALARVHERYPAAEIVLFGSAAIDSAAVTFPHVNRGLIVELDDLVDLYNSADVGIVFSMSNPSRMPLEMMACGLPVVELDTHINRVHYGTAEIAVLAEPSAEGVAEAVIGLLSNEERRQERVRRGLDYAAGMPDVGQAAATFEGILVEALSQTSRPHRLPRGVSIGATT